MSDEYINSPIANTHSAVYMAVIQSIGKKLQVRCGGCYRPIEILTKPGTVTHATYPATHGNCTIFVATQIIEVVWAALAQVVPEETPAGWGAIQNWVFSGTDPRRGERYGSPDFLGCASGAGALWGIDGWSTNGPVIASGQCYYPEIEVCESIYPIIWKRWEYARDSAGPGKWRGGIGIHNEWVANADPEPVYLNYGADPYDYAIAPAIAGGKVPPPNRRQLVLADGRKMDNEELKEKKFFILHNGDRLIDFVQGGCGVGDPLERDPEAVKADVRDELLSLQSAKNDYGVVIAPESFEIDTQATEDLRRELKKS
jgi:N-methylhydantoinase B